MGVAPCISSSWPCVSPRPSRSVWSAGGRHCLFSRARRHTQILQSSLQVRRLQPAFRRNRPLQVRPPQPASRSASSPNHTGFAPRRFAASMSAPRRSVPRRFAPSRSAPRSSARRQVRLPAGRFSSSALMGREVPLRASLPGGEPKKEADLRNAEAAESDPAGRRTCGGRKLRGGPGGGDPARERTCGGRT
jgi:hypothetical protein